MRFSLIVSLFLALAVTACSHVPEEPRTQQIKTSSSSFDMPGVYAFKDAGEDTDAASPVKAGRVSHFERKTIVPGGSEGAMTPCARNFDGIMDRLETLMGPQIEENNRMAAEQAAGYPL